MKITLRLLKIIFTIFKYRAFFLFGYLPFFPFNLFGKKINIKNAKKVVKILEDLGPFYIKLGQLLSSRTDILGNTLAVELKNLQDNVKVKTQHKDIKAHLEKELNIKFNDYFKDISSKAVACASVSFVYKATLLNNQEVAIKVLNKNLNNIIGKDLLLIKAILKLTLHKKNLTKERLEEIIKFIEKNFKFETDLRFEAAYIEEFTECYKNTPKLKIPEVIWKLSNKNILTTKWITGYKINEIPNNLNKKQIVEDFVRIFILQTLSKGFFHADMHGGNIIIDKNGNICLIDFGIMGRLDKKSKYYLARIFHSLLTKNYYDAAKAHIQAGYVSSKYNVDDFALACRAIASKIFKQKQQDISISSLLMQLFEITKMFEMKVQTNLILLQKSMLIVEGLAKEVYPKGNVWLIAKKYISDTFNSNAKISNKTQASYITSIEILEKANLIGNSIINISNNLTEPKKNNNKAKHFIKIVILTILLIFTYNNFIK